VTASEGNAPSALETGDEVPTPSGQLPLPFPPAMQLQISSHQGPLPPPHVLSGYEQVHPGAAAWILKEAEASASHTREMERLALTYQARDALLHRILPFFLVALLLIVSAAIAIFANVYVGGVAFGGTMRAW